MSPRLLVALAGAGLLASGCATTRHDAAQDLVGRSLRVETAQGQSTTLQFVDSNRVRARFGSRSLDGRWQAGDRVLCFFWGNAPRECWPYARPFQRGQTRTLTSDRGNVVRVTLL